jgi:hypothetical protein
MTTTVTAGEGLVHVFVAVDHCTSECVGLHAAKGENRCEALEPLRQGDREHFGGFGAKWTRAWPSAMTTAATTSSNSTGRPFIAAFRTPRPRSHIRIVHRERRNTPLGANHLYR